MKTSAQTLRLSILALVSAVALPAGLLANEHDDRIEKSFNDSYVNRTQLRDSDVSIDAENGVVTLKGSVQNSDQKRLAEDTVRGLPGVTNVRNELTVKSDPKESSDEWIALKVRSSLLYHRNVGLMDTDVKVMNGNVILTGVAETAAEKALAGEYAADIKGVQNVDNQIKVVPEHERTAWKANRDKERAEMRADKAELKADRDRAVAKADSTYDRTARDLDRKTDNAERNVRNMGNDAERSARNIGDSAERNARDMGDKMDDASITAQVKASLAVHKSTSAIRTEVTTNDGTVTLRGEARNAAEKELAGKIAKDVRGVRNLNNEIVVTKSVAGE
jgi:osmotically-inducible protein OsmY